MGEGRVQCPLCAKTLKVQRRTGTRSGGTKAKIERMTDWGTHGFGGDEDRDEYGEIRPGDELGGFRIEEMVGAGAMAVVYRATQLSLGRSVALKILPQRFAKRESFVRQFDSETALLASLNHPNIVTIIDRGREGDTYYFAMEFIEGTTLGELAAADKIDVDFFLQIMEQCGEALSYAHSKGIIHRDIKPANIMLNEQGVVKVADFGVAGIIAEARTDG
jgi:serine/threonine protein kinase